MDRTSLLPGNPQLVIALFCSLVLGCSGPNNSAPDKVTPPKAQGETSMPRVSLAQATELDTVVAANTAFGIDLYRALAKTAKGGNLFLSPYSITSALTMTLEGARGTTAQEMIAALRYEQSLQAEPPKTEPLHLSFAALNQHLTGADSDEVSDAREEIARAQAEFFAAKARFQALSNTRDWEARGEAQRAEQIAAETLNAALAKVDQYELNVANSLWGEKTYPFEPAFVSAIDRYYGTDGVFEADFKTNFPEERVRINRWVEDKTLTRIKDLVPELPPKEASLVRLILVNAIYFKGDWSEPFDEANTEDQPFQKADGSSIDVPMMHHRELSIAGYAAFNGDGSLFATPARMRAGQTEGLYPADSGFAVLELPYKGDELAMLLIAPNSPKGLAAVEQLISEEALEDWIAALEQRDTHVMLPRFKLEENYGLNEPLQDLGMQQAFNERAADFSGMTTSSDPGDRLYISQVIHKTFLEVNEKGTEAAAATAVAMTRTTSVPQTFPFTPQFRADRPFVFLIRDRHTGVVLFLGRYTTPK